MEPQVALDGPGVTQLERRRGPAPRRARQSLAQVVPQLIELDPDRLQPLRVARPPARRASASAALPSSVRSLRSSCSSSSIRACTCSSLRDSPWPESYADPGVVNHAVVSAGTPPSPASSPAAQQRARRPAVPARWSADMLTTHTNPRSRQTRAHLLARRATSSRRHRAPDGGAGSAARCGTARASSA